MWFSYFLSKYELLQVLLVILSFVGLVALCALFIGYVTDGLKGKSWVRYTVSSLFIGILALAAFILIPDKQWIIRYYGNPDYEYEIQQRTLRNQNYQTSKQLFLDCLDKAQRQPQSTTFNDTNEVVEKCYEVTIRKF